MGDNLDYQVDGDRGCCCGGVDGDERLDEALSL